MSGAPLARATPWWTVVGPLAGALLAVGAHLLAAARLGDLVASTGEADLAAAAYAGRGASIGPVALALPDSVAARQLALVETVLPASGIGVLDAARWAALAFGLLGVLLLWPLLDRLGTGPTAVAVTLGTLGAVPLVTDLHAAVGAAGPAAAWLVLAAALAGTGGRLAGVLAAPAAAVAVLTAPLAGAVVLGLGAHLLAAGALRRPAHPGVRAALAALLGALALACAVLAAGWGPLAGVGGPVVGTPAAVAGAVAGGVGVGTAWVAARWLRPVLTPAAVLLVVLLVPGPGRAAAAVLLLPLGGIVLAALVEAVGPVLDRGRTGPAAPVLARVALAGVVLVGVTSTSAAATGHSRATEPREAGVAGWIRSELPAGTVVHADGLDRAELVAAGLPPGVLAPLDRPPLPGEVVLRSSRPATGTGATGAPTCRPAGTLAVVERGTGGAPAVLCDAAGGTAAEVRAEAPRRSRLGDALAANRALDLAPGAADLLRTGRVDSRVVLVLAAMAGSRTLTVADFPAVPLDAPDALRRQVLISGVDGRPVLPEAGGLLAQWLSGQQPPFVPSTVRPTDGGLLVGYPAPTSTGLLPT